MDIRITDQLTRGQLRDLKKLYRSAFPASEKKPFWLIKMKKRAGITDILGLLDENNRLVGEIITIAWRDLLLVDYFAIAEQVRGQGCGTRALELLRERYNDRRILLEIEQRRFPAGICSSVCAGNSSTFPAVLTVWITMSISSGWRWKS